MEDKNTALDYPNGNEREKSLSNQRGLSSSRTHFISSHKIIIKKGKSILQTYSWKTYKATDPRISTNSNQTYTPTMSKILKKPSVPGFDIWLWLLTSWLLMQILWGSRWWLKYRGSCHLCGRPGMSSQLVTSARAWTEKELMDRISLTFIPTLHLSLVFFFASRRNKVIQKMKLEWLYQDKE